MTHLEILAGKIDAMGENALFMAAYCREQVQLRRAEYYHGQAVAFGRAADLLRDEAITRAQTDKEKSG